MGDCAHAHAGIASARTYSIIGFLALAGLIDTDTCLYWDQKVTLFWCLSMQRTTKEASVPSNIAPTGW